MSSFPSRFSSRRISPPQRLLTVTQQKALDTLGNHLKTSYAPAVAEAYKGRVKTFLHYSGLFEDSYNPWEAQPITQDHWKTFERALLDKGVSNLKQRQVWIGQAMRACFPDQDMPWVPRQSPQTAARRRHVPLAWDRNNLPTPGDKAFVDYHEKTGKLHRGDDFRRFLGLIHRASPALVALPPEQRFLESTLSIHLGAAFANLTKPEEFQRLHLVGEALNGFFARQDFTWLREAVLSHKEKVAPRKEKAARSSKRKEGFNAADLQSEPFLSIMDRAIPTLATPKSRIGNVRPLRPGSRRLYELDLAHLLMARQKAKIGSPHDDPALWFSQESIRALEAVLPIHMDYRTAGKVMVRLRRFYWRLFGTSQTLDHEYMTMVGRRFFQSGTPAPKRMDHIDAEELLKMIEARAHLFGEQFDRSGGVASSHDLVTYRNLLIFALMLSTGLRLENVTRLERKEIISTGTTTIVSIPAKKVKNNIALNLVLKDSLAEHIRRYLGLPDIQKAASDSVWLSRDGSPLGVDAVYRAIKTWSCLMLDETLTPHDLRRLFSSHLLQQGELTAENVAEALGHKDVNTTIRIYGTDKRPEFQSIFSHFPLSAAA